MFFVVYLLSGGSSNIFSRYKEGLVVSKLIQLGSFTDALASSINIGTAVYDKTKEEVSANIGNMPLNI